ncbi:DUF4032 domain-containing protein [Candidatus Poriferisodalis sp.]|uniref:DUF4032 domain-containing protein n=1 Tax=Candidatus Poriferisodalis sp. TaxID=3101277 RepID=UPI003AF4CED4
MVSYDGRVYALKETEQRLAEREYRVLRHLEDSRLPAVKAVGVVTGRRSRDGRDLKSMLITRFLDFALPYQHLFRTTATSLLRDRLLDAAADPIEITDELLDRYRWLWAELTREDDIAAHERWRIRERIERLNAMGFDVEELSVVQSSDGSRLRIRPVVVEEGHAHLRLRRLTGLEVQENQARTLLNAVDAYGLALEREAGHVLPESVKAYRWLSERYEPVIAAIPDRYRDRLDDAQLIYEFIEHRFERSKAAGRQVENDEAMVTFVDEVLERLPRERTLIDHDGGNDPGDVLLGAPELGAPEAPTPTAGEA